MSTVIYLHKSDFVLRAVEDPDVFVDMCARIC
jgi:hypothetical protein